jgi:hypothetical protein
MMALIPHGPQLRGYVVCGSLQSVKKRDQDDRWSLGHESGTTKRAMWSIDRCFMQRDLRSKKVVREVAWTKPAWCCRGWSFKRF